MIWLRSKDCDEKPRRVTNGASGIDRFRMYRTLRVLLLVILPGALQAQSADASLTGRITDPNKALITAAKVTVINSGTGVHYQVLTNEIVTYYVSKLPPGRYLILLEEIGFKQVI